MVMVEKCLFILATLLRILTGKERWEKDHKVKSVCGKGFGAGRVEKGDSGIF